MFMSRMRRHAKAVAWGRLGGLARGKQKRSSTTFTRGDDRAAAAGRAGALASNPFHNRQANRRGRTNDYPSGPAVKLKALLDKGGIEILKNLTPQEELAVQGRFLWGLSLAEIAAQLAVTKSRAGQLINSAARKQEES